MPTLRFPTGAVFALALAVGVVGGIYGIGGGALIAPVLVSVFHLPVQRIAGTALAATFLTSVVGVAVYTLMPAPPSLATAPDWLLGGRGRARRRVCRRLRAATCVGAAP